MSELDFLVRIRDAESRAATLIEEARETARRRIEAENDAGMKRTTQERESGESRLLAEQELARSEADEALARSVRDSEDEAERIRGIAGDRSEEAAQAVVGLLLGIDGSR